MEVDFSNVELQTPSGRNYQFSEFELHLSFEDHVLGFIFRAKGAETRQDLAYDALDIIIG
jgi:hypothetical protein